MAAETFERAPATGIISDTTQPDNDEGERAYALALGERINSITIEPLYTSTHLYYLSQFLKRPFQKPSKRRFIRELSKPTLLPFVIGYKLESARSPAAQLLAKPRDLAQFQETDSNYMLFLNGQPSANWLNALGYKLSINYLYLHQHLHPLVSGPSQPWNDGTDLPSRSLQTLVLRIPTVVLIGPQGRNTSLLVLERSRDACDSKLRRLHLALQAGDDLSSGKSMFRRVEVHNANTIVLDQQVTATVVRRGSAWTVLIWSDAGHETDNAHIPIPPTDDFQAVASDITFCPVLFDNDRPPGAGSSPKATKIKQPLALLSTRYGDTMDWSKCPTGSPLAALEELFFFQAASLLQYLHMLDRVLCDLSLPGVFPTYEHTKLETTVQYDYVRMSLGRAGQHCSDILEFLKNPPQDWRDAGDLSQSPLPSSIIRDFDYLLQRTRSLQKVCEAGKATLINNNSVQAAKRSAEEAKLVTQLTKATNRLTFIFLPISFVTSIFGMNFRQFGQGPLSIWIWAAVSIPMLAICILAVEAGNWVRRKLSKIYRRAAKD